MKLIMTPGPTSVRENVRLARAMETTNPDIDLEFYEFYKAVCNKIAVFLNTKNEVRILSGEGILGLEAACASLIEKDDKVLVIDNGIFGEGFADFVTMYGGKTVFFKGDRQEAVNLELLKQFLEENHDFKIATVVHCDTPSGVLNPIDKICPLLKSYNILTVVDSVAAMGGEIVKADEWNIDILLGASQKCISAPPGLTFMSISKEAFEAMEKRKNPIAGFYCNLLLWKNYYKDKWFPYTPPISDIVGLNAAMDNVLCEGISEMAERHEKIAKAVRFAVDKAGLKLHIHKGFSSTVTVIDIPEGIDEGNLRKYMEEKYKVLISGSFGYLSGKVLRIGHMGENASVDKVAYTLFALENSLRNFGFKFKELDKCMPDIFMETMQ